MANLRIPIQAPTLTTTTDTPSLQINQNVGYGNPLALSYSGAGKSIFYQANKTNEPFSSSKKYNGHNICSLGTYVAAFAALASDVFNFWVHGEFEPTLFSSLAMLNAYIDRDTRIAIAQHPLRNENRIFFRGKGPFFDIYPVKSLEEVCSSLLERISSFIKDKKVKDKGMKSRYKELQRILSPGNDDNFPHIDELWNSTGGNSNSDEDTESEDTDTDTATDRVKGRRALHVVKQFSSLGAIYNVTEWVDSDDNTHIIKRQYNGQGCGIDKQEARHQQMKKDMLLCILVDWKDKYDEELDLDKPKTLVFGKDKYVPSFLRPNDTDGNVSQEHIDSAEARWDAMYQQSINKRKQEQGEGYNPLFELGDESSSRKFFSIEDYEESIVSYYV